MHYSETIPAEDDSATRETSAPSQTFGEAIPPKQRSIQLIVACKLQDFKSGVSSVFPASKKKAPGHVPISSTKAPGDDPVSNTKAAY